MKPALLRPQALADLQAEVRYYRREVGRSVSERLVKAATQALKQIEQQPAMGSPVLGKQLELKGLRTWRIKDYPLLWCYFERPEALDVVRLLGERQNLPALLAMLPGADLDLD